jgi:hypothetical protein
LDNLHSGWKIGSYPKVACKKLAQWMKMDETSLFRCFRFIFAIHP